MTLLNNVIDSIHRVYNDKPVLADLAIRQAILESRLQGTPSLLATKYFNLFGIKDTDGKNKTDLLTTECNAKTCWNEKQPFEVFASFDDCIKWHRLLMQRPRYKPVWDAKTIEEACVQIRECGYATDPSYTKKLLNIKYEQIP